MIGTLYNDGWTFSLLPLDTPIERARASVFAQVEIPHDFLIWNASDLYASRDGWYRRDIAPAQAPRRTILRFDGVYMDTTVFVNGKKAFEWKYGYTTFSCDLTDFLKPGNNELLVRVRHESPNTRWYSGAGIYRNVWLFCPAPEHIALDGVYTQTRRDENGAWHLRVDTEVVCREAYTLEHTLLSANGDIAAECLCAGESVCLPVPDAAAWMPDAPVLYTLRTVLRTGERITDETETVIGFRETAFDPNEGFFINGRHMKLHGVCMHHDLGALGAAWNGAAARRQLSMLRNMGVNAIRTSHNPPAPELLAMCDKMGFLVIDEAFDMWEYSKTKYDYARFFPEWHERDVAAWIRRDRNHPCVILWSIGNEIYDTQVSLRGVELTRELADLVRKHDYLGNSPVTSGSNYMPWENALACADVLKIVGYNYSERLYKEHHEKHPDWCIYGSETSSLVMSRGIYHFPLSESILSDDDLQCSALGNSGTSWGAKTLDDCVIDDEEAPYSLGSFLWTGFDYIGEPTPYHTRNSYFGMIDTAGFPKDSYYVLKARWTDPKTAPVVHLYPHWDWNEGQVIDVRVCANMPRVRLSLNGELIGEQAIGSRELPQAHFRVPYRPGTLRAEALDEQGNVLAKDEQRSFGDAARLLLSVDRQTLRADGKDMAFITVSCVDKDGNPVRNANNRVSVRVRGAARLCGLDNGDSTDTDQYKGDSRRLFSGKLLVMLMARQKPGMISVHVSSPGLEGVTTFLSALPARRAQTPHCLMENYREPERKEIPIRKIELSTDASTALCKAHDTAVVTAKLYPKDATYDDIDFSIVNAKGIALYNATVTRDGMRATVRATSDGEFTLRCTASNGGAHPRLISSLGFSAEGFGKAVLDPYQFVSAGLYSISSGRIASGNERGVSVPPYSNGMFGFERLDFGAYGSDELTLSVFALASEPCDILVYDGVPEKGGALIATCVYQRKPIWNTYQEQTFRLSKRIRGMHTLCFASACRLHVKGFYFTRLERAWQRVPAAEADAIYGDSYRVSGEHVLDIGNNVTLTFEGMNFGGGTASLLLEGKSARGDTVHLRVKDETGKEQVHALSFPASQTAQERAFAIPSTKGNCTIFFVFLPGSQFDFHAFRFLPESAE